MQVGQERHRAGERSPLRKQLAVQLAVTPLDLLDLLVVQRTAQLAGHGASEEAAAHPDAPMDAPTLDRQAGLGQGPLPGEDVGVDRVDQRAVQVEDQRSRHPGTAEGSSRRSRMPRYAFQDPTSASWEPASPA